MYDPIDRTLLLDMLDALEAFTHADCYLDVTDLIKDMPSIHTMTLKQYNERADMMYTRLGCGPDEEAIDSD